MTDSGIYIHEDEDGTVTLSTLPITTGGPVQEYMSLDDAEYDETVLYRVIKAHQAYRDAIRQAAMAVEHPLAEAELAEALTYLSNIMTDQVGPAYERANREADRLDPDLNRDAPRRAT